MHGGNVATTYSSYYINNHIIKIQLTSYLCICLVINISYQPNQINLLVIHHAASISCLSKLAKSISYQGIANSQLQLQLCSVSENCNHGLGKIPLLSWHGSVSLSSLAMVASQLLLISFVAAFAHKNISIYSYVASYNCICMCINNAHIYIAIQLWLASYNVEISYVGNNSITNSLIASQLLCRL